VRGGKEVKTGGGGEETCDKTCDKERGNKEETQRKERGKKEERKTSNDDPLHVAHTHLHGGASK